MMKNLLSDWKGLKINGDQNDFDLGVFNLGESSAALCKQQQQSVWGQQKSTSPASSVWGSPQSPSSSTGTQYFSSSSHSNSKESLWVSTQSSPTSYSNATNNLSNANLKDLANLNNLLKNNNNVINLWENPISKLSQSSLMQCKEPLGAIWNPTLHNKSDQVQTKTIITTDPSFRLLRPHDIVSDTWNSSNNSTTNNNNHTTPQPTLVKHNNTYAGVSALSTAGVGSCNLFNTKVLAKEPVGSLWAKPTPPPPQSSGTNFLPTTKLTSMNSLLNAVPSQSSNMTQTPSGLSHMLLSSPLLANTSSNSFGPPPPQSAASSCLQLFSDEFLNYLNMIN